MTTSGRLLFVALLPLMLWWIAAAVTPAYLVPQPLDVFLLIGESWRQLLLDISITALESLGGLGLAFLLSGTFSLVFRLFPVLERFGMPYAIAIKSIPVVALAPLLVIWFGNEIAGKVVLATLICFFPILVGLTDGMKSMPEDLRRLAIIWSSTRVRRLMLLEFPYAMPYLFSALKVAAPLAVVGAVVAEFSGADRGIGHTILVAAYRIDTDLMFAGILLVSLLGIALYAIAAVSEKRLLSAMRLSRVDRPV